MGKRRPRSTSAQHGRHFRLLSARPSAQRRRSRRLFPSVQDCWQAIVVNVWPPFCLFRCVILGMEGVYISFVRDFLCIWLPAYKIPSSSRCLNSQHLLNSTTVLFFRPRTANTLLEDTHTRTRLINHELSFLLYNAEESFRLVKNAMHFAIACYTFQFCSYRARYSHSSSNHLRCTTTSLA